MNEEIKEKLRRWANEYNVSGFIKETLSSFPIGTRRKGILRCLLLLLPGFLTDAGN